MRCFSCCCCCCFDRCCFCCCCSVGNSKLEKNPKTRMRRNAAVTAALIGRMNDEKIATPDPRFENDIPLKACLLKASPADIREVCVPSCTQKAPNLRCCFLKQRLTNTPRCRRLANGELSSLYPPSPNFTSFGAASVMLRCSPPASRTHLRPSVYYRSTSLLVNIIYIYSYFL